MPLDPIGISLSDMMLKHVSELIAIPNQWTPKENEYLQRIQRALVHFKHLWELIEDDTFGLSHELRTPLSPIIGYRELIEFAITQPIPENIQNHLSYLYVGEKILLWKVNELVDRGKNPHLWRHQYRNILSLELNTFDLIDRMLDAAIELRLIPESWTDLQRDIIDELHSTVLRLNKYAQVLDIHELEAVNLIRSASSLVSHLIRFLNFEYRNETAQVTLKHLEKLAAILEAKVSYFSDKAYTNNGQY